MVTVPLGPVALALSTGGRSGDRSEGIGDRTDTALRLYFLLASIGHFSLFPLLYQPAEWSWKISVWLAYGGLLVASVAFTTTTGMTAAATTKTTNTSLHKIDTLVPASTTVLLPIEALFMFVALPAIEIVPRVLRIAAPEFAARFTFLPLMLYSVTCTLNPSLLAQLPFTCPRQWLD